MPALRIRMEREDKMKKRRDTGGHAAFLSQPTNLLSQLWPAALGR